ncbi:MAG TPA: M48 family metalloprotease [Actinomycetes bacterium]|nr:M48 family metalloprotease [Actinomycetes bacterium]
MSAAPVIVLGGPFLLLLLSPWLAARLFEGRAPARTVATFHLLALVGLAALPVTALGCLAIVARGRVAAAPLGLLALYLSRVAWAMVGVARATWRLAATTALAAAGPLRVPGGAGIVLAGGPPLAYALGGRSRRVVVSQSLLGLLDDDERAAVLAHELAHLRLGHHRLLRFAQVARAALGPAAPAARRAYAALGRELEAIADEAAAGAVADRRLVARALAKAALGGPAAGPPLAFGDERDLAYRLDRLTSDRPPEQRRTIATAGVGLLAVGVMVLLNAGAEPPGQATRLALRALCVGGVGWLCCRGIAPAGRAVEQPSTGC